MIINNFLIEYRRYKAIGEKALKQVPDDALNLVPSHDNNSVAIIVRHISGNLKSRFTDFLSTDGEKPWRNRDEEFEDATYSRVELEKMWAEGWNVLESELSKVGDELLEHKVYIRGTELTVHEALCRSVAHAAYHVGQIVFLARTFAQGSWKWISIPKGASAEYNKNPSKEKKLD